MNEWMMNSAAAGVVLSLAAYGLGTWARKKNRTVMDQSASDIYPSVYSCPEGMPY